MGFTSRSVEARLTMHDLELIGAKLADRAWTQNEVQRLRTRAQTAPEAPNAGVLAAFASCPIPLTSPPPRIVAPCLRTICRQRSELHGAIVELSAAWPLLSHAFRCAHSSDVVFCFLCDATRHAEFSLDSDSVVVGGGPVTRVQACLSTSGRRKVSRARTASHVPPPAT